MRVCKTLANAQKKYLNTLRNYSVFANLRQIGTITALDVKNESKGYLSSIGTKLRDFFRQQNVLLRPLGDVIYIMPPYCVNDEDLRQIYNAIAEAAL